MPWVHSSLFVLATLLDGGSAVRLKLASKGLSGTGVIWGGPVGGEAPDLPDAASDVGIADRLGDPDIKRCPPTPQPVARPVGMIGR